MDIREGDLLVVSGKEYPIRRCAEWSGSQLNSIGFRRRATIPASSKRTPTTSSAQQSDPVEHLKGLFCTPLDPVSAEIQQRVSLGTPMELVETYLGDESGVVHLVLEDLKVE